MTREEAIQILADLIDSPFLHTWEKQNKALHMAIEALSIDIVKCEDCIHYESDGGALMVCSITEMICDDTDFCSYGERKEV